MPSWSGLLPLLQRPGTAITLIAVGLTWWLTLGSANWQQAIMVQVNQNAQTMKDLNGQLLHMNGAIVLHTNESAEQTRMFRQICVNTARNESARDACLQ